MKRRGSRGLGLFCCTLLLAAICGSAIAYFSAGGTGTATAAVSELGPASITAASPEIGGTVSLAWSAAEAPGTGAVEYYLLRNGEAPGGSCPAQSSPEAVTECTDSGLEPGTYRYTVVALYHSWSAESAVAKAKVTVGPVAQFSIAASTTTPAVNAADNLTITALDANESKVTTYTGSHSLVFSGASPSPGGTVPTVANSGGTATQFGKATALTFTKGVSMVSSSKNGAMKLYRSGETEIDASEESITDPTPLVVTVSPGNASKFSLAAADSTPTAGEGDELTISALDTYGNVATSFSGTKTPTFSGPGTAPDGTAATITNKAAAPIPIGTSTALEFVAGVASPTAKGNGTATLYKSGTNTLKATEGSITTSTALSFSVAAAEASSLVLASSSTTPTANASVNLTLTAKDPHLNNATSYAGSRGIVFSGAEASPSGAAPNVVNSAGTQVSFGSSTSLTFTNGVSSVGGGKNGLLRLTRAGSAEVVASDGELTTEPLAFTVAVGAAKRVAFTEVSKSAGSLAVGCYFTCSVTGLGNKGTVSAKAMITDEVGNVLSAQKSKTVTVSSSGTSGSSIAGSPLSFPEIGAAISTAAFTYTAPTGSYSNTITAASTGLTSGTITTSK